MRPRVSQKLQDEIVLQNESRRIDVAAHATDAISFFATMQLMLFKLLVEKRNGPLFNSLLGYLFLPVAALAAIVNAAFSIRRAILKKNEGVAVARAVMQSLATAALLAAAIGLLVSTAIFAFVGPAIFAAVVGAKALFNAGFAIYCGVKAGRETEGDVKAEWKDKAKYAVVDAILGAAIASAMLIMLLVAAPVVQTAMAVVGVAASVFAYAFSRTKMKYPADRYQLDCQPADNEWEGQPSPRTNNANLMQTLGAERSGYVSLSDLAHDEKPAEINVFATPPRPVMTHHVQAPSLR